MLHTVKTFKKKYIKKTKKYLKTKTPLLKAHTSILNRFDHLMNSILAVKTQNNRIRTNKTKKLRHILNLQLNYNKANYGNENYLKKKKARVLH